MKKILLLLILVLLLTGCITIGPESDSSSGEIVEPEPIRLTREKIVLDEGTTYLIVTFPSRAEDHKGFLDEDTGEYVVISVLPEGQ